MGTLILCLVPVSLKGNENKGTLLKKMKELGSVILDYKQPGVEFIRNNSIGPCSPKVQQSYFKPRIAISGSEGIQLFQCWLHQRFSTTFIFTAP